jgi:hypothetical protein
MGNLQLHLARRADGRLRSAATGEQYNRNASTEG